MEEPHRHHYVSKGYLRGFSCPIRGKEWVWTYDKRPGRRPECKSVRSIAWEHDYYAQERPDGSTDYGTLEKAIGTHVDDKAAKLILELSRNPNQIENLEKEHRHFLESFVAFSHTRVPRFRGSLHGMFSEIGAYMGEIYAGVLAGDPSLESTIDTSPPQSITLDSMVAGASQIAKSLSKKSAVFVYSSNYFFITSDNPVVVAGNAAAAHDSHIFMALSKNLAVHFHEKNGEKDFLVRNPREWAVDEINSMIAETTVHRIFASQNLESLEKLIKKHPTVSP